MRIGTYDSLLGTVSIATTDNLVCGITFGSPDILLSYLRKHRVHKVDNEIPFTFITDKVLTAINTGINTEIQIYLYGTAFQIKVWQELLKVPTGITCKYQEVANRIGRPNSVRAVANAVGANPIAVLVPCHRIIHSDGSLSGYRWGKELKKKLLKREGITSHNW